MAQRYLDLKPRLGLVPNPFLRAFELYCEDMQSNTRVLEWSCKLRGGAAECGRFLHTAREPDYSKARLALDRLFAFLEDASGGRIARTFFARLPELAQRAGQGLALGYAQEGTGDTPGAELKLYVATSRVAQVRPVIEEIVPDGGACPRDTGRVMIAASLDQAFAGASRVYYLWDRKQLAQREVAGWLDTWCTREEIELAAASGSATVSLAFKKGERDMLYLSSPFGSERINRWLVQRLSAHPLLLQQLGELRWIGFSKRGEGLESDELNVYFSTSA
jgi:hypothetical protein